MPLLLPKFEETKRCKRGIIGILFKAIIGIALGNFSAFLRQRKSKALYKGLLAMRKQQDFHVNSLEYLEEVMTLHGTYSANSIDKIVDAINHLHKTYLSMKRFKVVGSLIGIMTIFWKGQLHTWFSTAYFIYMGYK